MIEDHKWYWPFHSWTYWHDGTLDGVIHTNSWCNYRKCPCGLIQKRLRIWAWPRNSFPWRTDEQAVRDAYWQRKLDEVDKKYDMTKKWVRDDDSQG